MTAKEFMCLVLLDDTVTYLSGDNDKIDYLTAVKYIENKITTKYSINNHVYLTYSREYDYNIEKFIQTFSITEQVNLRDYIRVKKINDFLS